ncbi:MAG: dTDP-4-dehydrorhamnose 3,5-epimerase [bacterium]|nr:dTDP-4-dehydrorhamnose 3,5-epimerase [bacterium]
MKFSPTELSGVWLIDLERHSDERGFFARTWCRDELADHGLDPELAQSSISHNRRAGTLRGMHYQAEPHAESKIVSCVRGAIYDVVLDLRPHSVSYRRWLAVELSAERGRMVYIPKGCAHGFQTLTDDAVVDYRISVPYAPDHARGVRWDDPAFAIAWPAAEQRTISDRDRSFPDFAQ